MPVSDDGAVLLLGEGDNVAVALRALEAQRDVVVSR